MKGKVAWICVKDYKDPDLSDDVEILFHEPDRYRYKQIIKIIYFEVEG